MACAAAAETRQFAMQRALKTKTLFLSFCLFFACIAAPLPMVEQGRGEDVIATTLPLTDDNSAGDLLIAAGADVTVQDDDRYGQRQMQRCSGCEPSDL